MDHIETIIKDKTSNLVTALRQQSKTEIDLAEALKTKFPNIESISISAYSIYIYTEKHSVNVRLGKSDMTINMTCDGKMPETVEEFIEAKKYMEEDKAQAMTAMYYLLFRLEDYYEAR